MFHQSAFAGASRLTTIYCPSITSISAYCFDGCSSLSSIDAPNLTVLGDTAFKSCTALTTVNFPNFKGTIPYATFSGCIALNNISFGSVKGIGSSAFFACRSLTSISFPYATYISTNAFCYCSALSTVVNMDHLMSVHGMAFYSCSQLSNFDAPNLETVGSNAFAYTGFDNISFRYLTGIGSYAFSNCSNLENVNLSYLSYAGTSGIFYRCSNLRSFVAPRLEYFGGEMFSECGLSIAYVRGWIGNNVFMSCSSLTTVVYQDGFVRSCYMANNAFRYSPVSTIYLLATSSIVELYSSTALSNTAITSTTGYIGVPESMYNTYISAYGWSYFSEIIMPLTDSMINTILANAPKPPRYIEREVRDTGLPWTITADFSSFLNGETINVHLVVATESSGQPVPVDVCNHQFVWGDDSYIFTLSAASSTLQCTIDVTNSSFKLQLVSGTNYGTYFLIIESLE